MVILLGLPVSLFGVLCAWQFAERIAKNRTLAGNIAQETKVEKVAPVYENTGLGWAVLPIFIPIILIVFKSLAQLPSAPFGQGTFKEIALFIGEPFIALSIGFLFALKLPKKFTLDMWSTKGWLGEALLEAAIILLITGAGGAFGKVLQNSPLSQVISGNLVSDSWGIWLPFVIAAALKSAQGSSTVAIITTASLVAPLVNTLGLDTQMGLALTVLATGAGSVVVSHANDSFFWVVTQLSGMNISEGYRYQTTGTAVLGCSAMLMVFILSIFLL
jgi:GntP family gluconate:H+ symporter